MFKFRVSNLTFEVISSIYPFLMELPHVCCFFLFQDIFFNPNPNYTIQIVSVFWLFFLVSILFPLFCFCLSILSIENDETLKRIPQIQVQQRNFVRDWNNFVFTLKIINKSSKLGAIKLANWFFFLCIFHQIHYVFHMCQIVLIKWAKCICF